MARQKSNGKAKTGKRKSRAESMTGAKDAKVEVRSLGHNSGDLDLPEPIIIESSDFHMHMRAIKAAMEKKDTAVQLLNGCYKAAKKLNKDLPDAIRKVITVERANDPFAFKQSLEVLGIALRETGSPVQLTIHDTLEGDVNEAAYKRGLADGEAGRPASNRYPEHSDLSEQYANGWAHGQGKKLGLSVEETDAARDGDDEFDRAAPVAEHNEPELEHA